MGSLLCAAEKAGHFNLVLREIDIERGPDRDLREKQLWESIFAELQQGDWFLIVSPPCNSFSRARFQYRKHPGPRPLRNRTWPKGLPWLSRHNKQIVAEANNFIDQCLAACQFSVAAGGRFLLEHPEDPVFGGVVTEEEGNLGVALAWPAGTYVATCWRTGCPCRDHYGKDPCGISSKPAGGTS